MNDKVLTLEERLKAGLEEREQEHERLTNAANANLRSLKMDAQEKAEASTIANQQVTAYHAQEQAASQVRIGGILALRELLNVDAPPPVEPVIEEDADAVPSDVP